MRSSIIRIWWWLITFCPFAIFGQISICEIFFWWFYIVHVSFSSVHFILILYSIRGLSILVLWIFYLIKSILIIIIIILFIFINILICGFKFRRFSFIFYDFKLFLNLIYHRFFLILFIFYFFLQIFTIIIIYFNFFF